MIVPVTLIVFEKARHFKFDSPGYEVWEMQSTFQLSLELCGSKIN